MWNCKMSASSPKIIPFEFCRKLCDAGLVIRFLGRLLFPRLPSDLQRRKINIILAVLLVGLLLGGLLALIAIVTNRVGAR
jgi:hypothetical protein